MTYEPGALPAEALDFLRERHLATLTTLRADGSPHVVPVGFTWDAPTGTARVITRGGSAKTRHAAADPRVAISQVDGGRWITVEGRARVTSDPAEVADAVARYAVRYRQPGVNPERVAIVVTVERVLASAAFGTPKSGGTSP